MRSLFAKILLSTLATFAVALLALWAVSRALPHRGVDPFGLIARMVAMIEDEACEAFEEGGPARLRAKLRRVDEHLPGEHLLTDAQGRDLATGHDRSDLLREGVGPPGPPRPTGGRLVLVGRPRGGRYRFISVLPPWPGPPGILPYFGAVVLVIAAFGAGLAVHLVAPLLRLRRAVDAFGRGDLGARIGSTRRDEIGELGRAFDEMAGRIGTLLAAERRLLQDVSHELRSPLARLGFAIELARTSEDRGSALDRIQKDVGRLNHLVNELLQLTRVEGDPGALDAEEVRVDELLRGVADDCGMEAAAKGCRLAIAAAPAAVLGERELLRRAVENVLRNAVRHAPGGSTVEVELRLAGGTATIATRDRGEGVPEEALGAIFEPFFRVEGDRSRTSGGAGLGLSIARRAVALHRGRIAARNAGPGLLVAIELPGAWDPEDAGPTGGRASRHPTRGG